MGNRLQKSPAQGQQKATVGEERKRARTGRTHITLKKLQKCGVIERTAPDWEKITIALELDDDGHKIETIKRDCCGLGVQTCCLQAFQLWLKGKGKQPVTWDTLVGCLEDVGYKTLADEIREKLHLERCASNSRLSDGSDVSTTDKTDRSAMGKSCTPRSMSRLPTKPPTFSKKFSTVDETDQNIPANSEVSSCNKTPLRSQEAGALDVFPSADLSTYDDQANACSSIHDNTRLLPEHADSCLPPLQREWRPHLHHGTSSTSVCIGQLGDNSDRLSQWRSAEVYPRTPSSCGREWFGQSSQVLEDSDNQVSFVLSPRSQSFTTTASGEFSVGQDSTGMDHFLHGVSHYPREVSEYSRYQADRPTCRSYSNTSSIPDFTTRRMSADHSISRGLAHFPNEKPHAHYSDLYHHCPSISHVQSRIASSPNLSGMSQSWGPSMPVDLAPRVHYCHESPSSRRNTCRHSNSLPHRKDSITSCSSSAVSGGCMFLEPIQRSQRPYQKERTYYSSSHFQPRSNSFVSSHSNSSESLSLNRPISMRLSQTQRDSLYCKGNKEKHYQYHTLPSHSSKSSIPDFSKENLSLRHPMSVPVHPSSQERSHYPKDMARSSGYHPHHSLTNMYTPHSSRYTFYEVDPSDECMLFHRPTAKEPIPREWLHYPNDTPHYSEYPPHHSLVNQPTDRSNRHNFCEPNLSDDNTFIHRSIAMEPASRERLHYSRETPHYPEYRHQLDLTSQSTPYSHSYNVYEADDRAFFHHQMARYPAHQQQSHYPKEVTYYSECWGPYPESRHQRSLTSQSAPHSHSCNSYKPDRQPGMRPTPQERLHYPMETPHYYPQYHQRQSLNHTAPYYNSSEPDFYTDWYAGPQRHFQDTPHYGQRVFADYPTPHSRSFIPVLPTEGVPYDHPTALGTSFQRDRQYSQRIPYSTGLSGSYSYSDHDQYPPSDHPRYHLPHSQSSSSSYPYSFSDQPRYRPVFVDPAPSRQLQECSQDSFTQEASQYPRNLPPYSNLTSTPRHPLPREQLILHRPIPAYPVPRRGPSHYYQENRHPVYL